MDKPPLMVVRTELCLYFGRIGFGGLLEGPFNPNVQSEEGIWRYNQALSCVQDFLRPKNRHMIQYGIRCLVTNEDNASKLIEFSERSIPRSTGTIQLLDCIHGSTRFYRKISFLEWSSEHADRIAKEINEKGYLHEDVARDSRIRGEPETVDASSLEGFLEHIS